MIKIACFSPPRNCKTKDTRRGEERRGEERRGEERRGEERRGEERRGEERRGEESYNGRFFYFLAFSKMLAGLKILLSGKHSINCDKYATAELCRECFSSVASFFSSKKALNTE